MSDLFIAVLIFLLSHIIPSYRPLRQAIVSKVGEKTFMSAYGLLSLVLFIWLITSYLQAPYIELWPPLNWMKGVTLFIMFWVCLLLVCTFSQPNPFSIGMGGKNFDPEKAGIVSITKHPGFVAFALWSGAHMIPNGDLASMIFFGLMCGLSLYGPKSLNDKRKSQLGAQKWSELNTQTRRKLPNIGLWRWLVTVILYMGLIHAHGPVIGALPYWW